MIVPQAVLLTLFIWALFDYLLSISWPQTYLGSWFTWVESIPSV